MGGAARLGREAHQTQHAARHVTTRAPLCASWWFVAARVRSYLVLFLKFIASVVPTIE